jgi:transcriptional/translational regulatory protein YebC/TACO1
MGLWILKKFDGDPGLEIYTDYSKMASVRDAIAKLGYVLREASLIKEAKMDKTLTGDELEKAQSAIEKLEDYQDTQDVWTDLVLD